MALLDKVCPPQACTVTALNHTYDTGFGNQQVNCADKELTMLEPVSGQTCGSYLAEYIQNRGGYVTNPDATSACAFCATRTTDEFLGPIFKIFYHDRWRDLGLFCAYILINVSTPPPRLQGSSLFRV